MRPRMTETDSYIAPFEVGQIMEGGGLGVVVESRHPDYKPGDVVKRMLHWPTQQGASPGRGQRTLESGAVAWKDYGRAGRGVAHGVCRLEADWRAKRR